MSTEDSDAGRRLVEAGSAITGDAAGAAIGFVFAGPLGAIGGAIAGSALGLAAREYGSRLLGYRERARAGAVIQHAAEAISEALGAGARLRDDGFFEHRDGRSSAETIAEGVVLAARDAFEEMKLPYLGRLYAQAAMHPELDAALCASVLRDATNLSWRQLVMIAAVGRNDRLPLPAVEVSLSGSDWSSWGASLEMGQLHEQGFMSGPTKYTEEIELPLINTALREQRLSNRGLILHQLLGLEYVPDGEVMAVHDLLAKGKPSDG
jgi:hypothetical protein